jgi:hypothetical protein
MELGIPEPVSVTYFVNPSLQSLCLCVYPHIVAMQRLGKGVMAGTNIDAIIEELLEALFSMRLVSYQRKVGNLFFPVELEFLSSCKTHDLCL